MVERDVVIVGAGPAGLAAAIACGRRGLSCEVLEKDVLVNSIFRFPTHMVFFTTPELLEIGGLPLVSPFEKPTRLEALRYYRRVADTFKLPVRIGETVDRVEQADGALHVQSRDVQGELTSWRARAVILAIGYYDHPNRLGVPGEDLPHVSHYYTEPHPFYRKRVVVVGGANSAAEASLELYRAGASVTLVHRGTQLSDSIKYWVLPDVKNRIAEGAIAARFEARVVEIRPGEVEIEAEGGPSTSLRAREAEGGERGAAGGGRGAEDATEQPWTRSSVPATLQTIPADAVFLLTGYHPDRELLARCGVGLQGDGCLPVHDAETFETNVPNLFVAGGVISDGHRHPIFIENGRFHGERIVEVIASRMRSHGG